jgi:hypothetical protein
MSRINDTRARAVADLREGLILASVEVAASPEGVCRALASNEITHWWVRPGVFDTREWTGDVRAGGRWRASGMTRGDPRQPAASSRQLSAPAWRLGLAGPGAGCASHRGRLDRGDRDVLSGLFPAVWAPAADGPVAGDQHVSLIYSMLMSLGRA